MSDTLNYARVIPARGDRPTPRWLHYLAVLLVPGTFFLILAGGNVTSKGAGLAVPDWPTSFGSVNPEGWTSDMGGTRPGVRAEHGHRLIGAAVGLAILIVSIGLGFCENRAWVRKLGYATLAAVVVQGLMGGFRVTELSLSLAIIHGCFAQVVLCLTIVLALATSGTWMKHPGPAKLPAEQRLLRFWTRGLVIAVFGQLILGALLRHTGQGAVVHIAMALVVGMAIMQAVQVVFSFEDDRLVKPMIAVMLGYGVQLMLGVMAYMIVLPIIGQSTGRAPLSFLQTYLPTAHVGVGALILGLSFLIALRAHDAGGLRRAAEAADARAQEAAS